MGVKTIQYRNGLKAQTFRLLSRRSSMKNLFALILIGFLSYGCAATTPRTETYMGKAVFDVNIHTPSNEVVKNVYDSLALRSDRLTKTVAFMPSALPEQPGTPNIGIRSMGMGIVTFSLPQTTCDGAFAVMSGFDKGVSSSTYGTSDFASYTSCIYPYRDAFRVYLVGNFMSSNSGGLQGLMADAIKKGVSGATNYDNIFAAWFDSIIKRLREKLPEAKEIEIAMP